MVPLASPLVAGSIGSKLVEAVFFPASHPIAGFTGAEQAGSIFPLASLSAAGFPKTGSLLPSFLAAHSLLQVRFLVA